MKKVIYLSLTILTGCANDIIGGINDKYGIFGGVPTDFAKNAPNEIGIYKFLGFGKSNKTSPATHQAYYYNPKPLSKTKDGGEIIEVYAYNNGPLSTDNGKEYNSIKNNIYINCEDETSSDLKTIYLATKEIKSRVVEVKDESKSATVTKIPHNRLDYVLYKKICPK